MDKINELMLNMDLLFAYLEKVDYYDQLTKNEGTDKYIMSVATHNNNKKEVEVCRVSKIKETGLKKRIYLLDQGNPVVYSCNDYKIIYSYLSEVKVFYENVCEQVKEQLTNSHLF